MREPEFNVATWNLTHRRATGTAPYDIRINDRPLVFYHFSGFDSGRSERCLIATARTVRCSTICATGTSQRARSSLRRVWAGSTACLTRSGTAGESRMLTGVYRSRPDLMHHFPDPFETANPRASYFRWFELHGPAERLRPLVKLLKKSAPPKALRLARSARSAWHRWSKPA